MSESIKLVNPPAPYVKGETLVLDNERLRR